MDNVQYDGKCIMCSHCNTDEEGWSLLTHHSIQVTLRSPTKGRFSQHHSEASAPQRSGKDSFAEWLKKKNTIFRASCVRKYPDIN